MPLVVEFVSADAVPVDSLNLTIDVIDHQGDCRQTKGSKCIDDAHSSQVAAFKRGMVDVDLGPRMPSFSNYDVVASPRDDCAVTAALTALSEACSWTSAEQAHTTLRPLFKSFNENDVNALLRHIPNDLDDREEARTKNSELVFCRA